MHSTPTVVGDVVLVGSSFKEGFTVVTHNNSKGLARAFDVRTGKTLWTFNTIPRPGEVGSETWENDSWSVNGNTGVWTQITVDPEAGLVYLPVESPTSDLYGGHRPGNNLFGESLVAVDLKTGVRKWHFQFVHHPIWDMDMSSAPLLIDTTVEGRPRKLVAVPSKQGWLYVFDRITGQPIWPIEERPVPQSDVPGEKTSPTQPHVTKPPAYARNFLKVPDDVIDFTPEMRAQGLEVLKRYKNGPLFNPRDRRQHQRDRRRAASRQRRRRHQLAGRIVRRRNRHRLRAGQQLGARRDVAAQAAARLLGHELRVGSRRHRVPGSTGTWIRHCGRFAIGQPSTHAAARTGAGVAGSTAHGGRFAADEAAVRRAVGASTSNEAN